MRTSSNITGLSAKSLWQSKKGLGMFFLLFIASSPASTAELTLPGYQREDGAIVLHYGGDRIDFYFASKALLAAKALGLNIDVAASAWIEWAINQQLEDGRFDRICIEGDDYRHCDKADADDAVLAVWVELLLTIAPKEGLPSHWHKSWQQANNYLVSLLLDRTRGIYVISRSQRVGLLMDNIEVYSAFNAMADYYIRLGDAGRAQLMKQRAAQLKERIVHTFWRSKPGMFNVSTDEYDDHGFYPDVVAQLYPLLAGMVVPGQDARTDYNDWIKLNRQAWLVQGDTDYPWGLVALLASQMGDDLSVECWVEKATPLRHGPHWNVLEEAVFQGLNDRAGKHTRLD